MSIARLKSFGLVGLALAIIAPVLQAQSTTGPTKKMKAAGIKAMMIESNEIKLPAEFQVSLYEGSAGATGKESGSKAYREGDRRADSAADLVILHTSVTGFKEGSERLRQVTMVARSDVDQCTLHVHRRQRQDFARRRH